MRALLQRVSAANVEIGGTIKSEINCGLCVFLGVAPDDTENDISWLVEKILNLRIFDDSEGRMNRSLLDNKGEVLVVSQFTLFADCKKGRRPSWGAAAEPRYANAIYEQFVESLRKRGVKTGTGVFQAHMTVGIYNDGPVTILIDTRE